MADMKKLLDIINETSVGATSAGSVATVAQPMTTTQKRIKEEDKSKTPEVLEYGNWENSALTTSNQLKKSRKHAAKIVKSIYGEDTMEEAQSPKQQAAIAIAKKKKVAEGLYDDDGLSYNERYKLSREIEKSPQEVELIANRLTSYVDEMEPEMFTRWGVEFLNDKIQKIARMAIVGRDDSLESLMSKLKSELKKDDEQDVAEGYILKKTKVEKTFTPGDPGEYYTSGGADVTRKDTDYEIINNKTGQVVGTASWTTNDYFGPGALKITMKNGATRWLDIWEREKGNPQTAFNRFVKDPKTAKKYKEQGVAEGSVSKEKQKTPYRDINSPEYRAAANKQKEQMAKDKAAEPGKKLADKIAKKGVAEDTGNDIKQAFQSFGAGISDASLAKGIEYILKGRYQEGENWLRSKKIPPEIIDQLKTIKVNSTANLDQYINDKLIPYVKNKIALNTQQSQNTQTTPSNYSVGLSDNAAAKKIADKLMGMPVTQKNVGLYVKKYLSMVGRTEKDLPQLSALVIDELEKQGVAEGSGDKVHLKTPKHGLADHPGRDTGVGLRTFAQTPEQDRCPKCNSLFKNHYKQGVAEGSEQKMSVQDTLAYLKKVMGTESHEDWRNHIINTNEYFVLKDIPVNSLRSDLSGLDKANVEKYKQMDFSKAPPIVIGSDGNILDGYHRVNVAKALKVPTLKAWVGMKQQGVVEDTLNEFYDEKNNFGGDGNDQQPPHDPRNSMAFKAGWKVGQEISNEIPLQQVLQNIKYPDELMAKFMSGFVEGRKAKVKWLNSQLKSHGRKATLRQNGSIKISDITTESEHTSSLEESDLIIAPASMSKLTRGLIKPSVSRVDHEISMAKSDLYQSAKNSIKIFELIKDKSEEEGIEGWVQEKIIKATDYLNTVREYLEGQKLQDDPLESMDGVGPSTKMFTSENKKTNTCESCGKKWKFTHECENHESIESVEEDAKRPGLWANIRAKQKRIKSGSGERMREPGSAGAPTDKQLKDIRKASNESTCSECGGPSYDDPVIAEEKDACYHKVKSRYKVWPSAYASGALVKCRKVGAKNWGNKSKK